MNDPVGPDTRVTMSDHVHTREFDGEVILLHLERGDYFALNDAGAAMWHQLAKGRSPAEVASALAVSYEVSESTLMRDCLELVKDLLERGLVRGLEKAGGSGE